jgi:hypothetical protein
VSWAARLRHRFTIEEARKILADQGRAAQYLLEGMDCEYFVDDRLRDQVSVLAEGLLRIHPRDDSDLEGDRAIAAVKAFQRCRVNAAGRKLIVILQDVQRYNLEDEGTWILIEAAGVCGGRDSVSTMESFVLSHRSPPHCSSGLPSNIVAPQESALAVLAEYGGPTSIPALKYALSDPYYRVRKAALVAVRKLKVGCELRESICSITEEDAVKTVREEAEATLRETPDACRCKSGVQGQPQPGVPRNGGLIRFRTEGDHLGQFGRFPVRRNAAWTPNKPQSQRE